MFTAVKRILFVTSAGLAALIFLSAFALAYKHTGAHNHQTDGASDYKWDSRQLMTTMDEGFACFRMNADGYNNLFDDYADTDILLMGSSHIEAVQMKKTENIGSLLNAALPLKTYSIGISGHALSTCMKNLSAALKKYSPARFVMIETNSVSILETECNAILNGTLGKVGSNDERTRVLQKILPSAKLLFNSLDKWKNISSLKVATPSALTECSQDMLDRLMQKAVREARGHGVTLVIFYHPSVALAKDGSLMDKTNLPTLERFSAACEKNGVVFVNVMDDFRHLYRTQKRLPYGFPNTGVGVGHLNRYGHKAIAERLCAVIAKSGRNTE